MGVTRRVRVLLDCDGILADFITPCLSVLHELLPERYQHDDVSAWDIMSSLGVPAEVGKEAYKRMRVPGFCMSLPTYPGATLGVAALIQLSELYIVTAPFGGPYWTDEREQWLKGHFNIDRHHVIHVSDKHVCQGDVFIDDKTSTLVKWRTEHPTGVAVRWNKRYNMNDEWDGIDTGSWDVLAGIVVGFAAARGLECRELT